MESRLRAAALQMVTTGDVRANADRICEALAEARAEGASLLVAPECALSGYPPSDDLDFDLLREQQDRVCRCAAEHEMYLALGTVDRKFVDGAGLRGLHPNGQSSPRVVNIGWNSRYSRLGWAGSHTDATSQAFVQHEIAPRIFGRPKPPAARTAMGSAPHLGGLSAVVVGLPLDLLGAAPAN